MKKVFKYAMAVALTVATVGFTACTPGEEEKPIENDGTYYAFHLQETGVSGAYKTKINALDTAYYQLTEADMQNDYGVVSLYLENRTSGSLSTTQKVEILEGPAKLANDEYICGGGSCPWNKAPYTLVPGINEDKPLAIDIHPSDLGSATTALFRLTVGEADKFDHATIIYLRLKK